MAFYGFGGSLAKSALDAGEDVAGLRLLIIGLSLVRIVQVRPIENDK